MADDVLQLPKCVYKGPCAMTVATQEAYDAAHADGWTDDGHPHWWTAAGAPPPDDVVKRSADVVSRSKRGKA